MAKKRATRRQTAAANRRAKAKLMVETDQVVGEVRLNSIEAARLRLITYTDNPYLFVDIRVFSRGFTNDGEREVFYPTRKGIQMKAEDFRELLQPFLAGRFSVADRPKSH